MAAPSYVWRESLLYSKIPELKQLDIDIAEIFSSINFMYNSSNTIYEQSLSNCGSFSNLFESNPGVVYQYANFLEQKIVGTGASMNLSVLFEQKIQLLESVYSNLMQTSTQSV